MKKKPHLRLFEIFCVCFAAVFLCAAFFLLYLLLRKPAAETAIPRNAQNPEIVNPAKPDGNFENAPVFNQEILSLRKQYGNNDIIGVLKIEGTTVDYPVTQAADNDFYLTRDIYKKKSPSGWVFLDCENYLYPLDKNTVIYGHNMKERIMFHDLRLFADYAFFEKHRTLLFKTLYADTEWEIFAFFKTDVSLNYLEVMPNEEDFTALIEEIKKLAEYDAGVTVSASDNILCLSTCTGVKGEEDMRSVLAARLVK